MLLKILLVLVVFLVVCAPLLFGERLKVKPEDVTKWTPPVYKRWTGPKTDERINRMFAESIALMRGLNVPISDSICPTVGLTSSHSYFGRCCPRKMSGKRSKYQYDFYIQIPGWTLNNSEKNLRNTLIHELIHTVPGGLCHTGQWKKWAKYVNERTDYHIQRCGGDDVTPQDLRNLQGI